MKSHPQRRSTRLPNYDYSQPGAYYVTICTHHRESLFGDIQDDVMRLNENGTIVQEEWLKLPSRYPHVRLDHAVIMPNHFHGIVILVDKSLDSPSSRRHALPEIIRSFKSFSSGRINRLRKVHNVPVWQRSFYEHVVRDEAGLNRIRQYIIDNPTKWATDQDNPAVFKRRHS